MSLKEEVSSINTREETDRSWVLVQPGLFHYPLANGEPLGLLANRCENCGRTFFPRRVLCPCCFDNGSLEDITLNKRGIVYACTVVHIPSPVGIETPYAYGYVEIPANNIRVFALFTGDDPYSFTPGREVELVLEPIRVDQHGKHIIGYKFKPVS